MRVYYTKRLAGCFGCGLMPKPRRLEGKSEGKEMQHHNFSEVSETKRLPYSLGSLRPIGLSFRFRCFPSPNSPQEHNARARLVDLD
jgi:hypothetical protein